MSEEQAQNRALAQVETSINKQLFNKLQLAYFAVDDSLKIKTASSNLVDYGFPQLQPGQAVDDHIDFMIGMDFQTELDLPFLSSPSGIPISVNMMPSKEQLTVLISDASNATEQRRMLQQAANENELLVEEQKRLMSELETASKLLEEKNRLLEEASRLQTSFLSGVSHEFRTPLTSIIGYTNLVQRDLDRLNQDVVPRIEKQNNVDFLNAVQRSSKHLLSLVENLLDHGKLDSDEIVIRPRETSLNELFRDVRLVLAPLGETKNIDFDVELDLGEDDLVAIDDSRLRQCLINLVGNAIKFTDHGSVVLAAKLEQDHLYMSVTDTGIGISEDDLEKIRLPFYQAPDTGKIGTGLGLTITERIVDLMGGKLSIESKIGHGTKVNLLMPAPAIDRSTNTTSKPIDFEPANLKILVAEDDSFIADLVVMMLQEQGVDVKCVGNGALALEAVQQERFDLILMDIHMPVMTGYEAINKLNQSGSTIPIVVMSASATEGDQARAAGLGCAAYMVKPVDIHEILTIANTVTGKQGLS